MVCCMQVSDWEARPLSQRQVVYAAQVGLLLHTLLISECYFSWRLGRVYQLCVRTATCAWAVCVCMLGASDSLVL